MSRPGDPGTLRSREWDFLHQLAERMEEALDEDPTADLTDLLPPPSAPRDRLIALHEMIKIELGYRWSHQRPITLEDYLERFPELGSASLLPVALIYEEYRARHLYGDHPTLESYKKRFPQQFEELQQKIRLQPEATFAETNNPFTKEIPESATDAGSPPPAKVPPTATPVPPPSTQPPSNSSTSSTSRTFLTVTGGYELLQPIGHGQFGEVFKARSPGGKMVALKRIFRPLDDAATQREHKALDLILQLDHPYLLQTHLYWIDEGRLHIVMELADGSLTDWLKEHQAKGLRGIPVQPLLEYFLQAAKALDYLHSQKPPIMHRDIKPANLLRINGFAKVADFGLAREQDNNLMTATFCGTPTYMPPEMWDSKVHRNSDQYSLAVTYVEMRLGRRCFNADNRRDMAFQHLEGRADLRGLQPAEQAVISRALSPDPEKRYPSCQAFIQALLDLHAPPPPKPPGSRWSTFVLATGLVMALSVIAVLIYGLLRPRVYLCPPGWQPPSGNLITNFFKPDLVQDLRGRHYWRSLSHRVGNQEVVMLVIPSKKSTDPNTFYIMRDKVSNDLFKAVMETERAKELLDTRLRESGLQTTDDKLPNYIQLGQWKRGARVSNFPAIGASTFGWLASPGGQERLLTAAALTIEKSETDLGIAGENGKLPVLGVTVLEAHVFAEVLGCKLPQKVQILKAAGYGEEGSGEGPFQLDPQLASRDPYDPQRYPGIAINLTELGPRPVGTSEKDVSIYGCRDLAGNGMELTRTLSRPDDPREVPVKGIGNTIPRVCIVGKNYEDDTPWRFKDVLHNTPDVPYNVTTHYYSFRIVLEE